jgi:hypothetical protein
MATSWQQDGIGLAHLHGMDHDLGSICPNNHDDLKESSRRPHDGQAGKKDDPRRRPLALALPYAASDGM